MIFLHSPLHQGCRAKVQAVGEPGVRLWCVWSLIKCLYVWREEMGLQSVSCGEQEVPLFLREAAIGGGESHAASGDVEKTEDDGGDQEGGVLKENLRNGSVCQQG